MASHRYTREEFSAAVAASGSIRQVLIKLKLAPRGGSYKTYHRLVDLYELDTSHFHGRAWNKGRKTGPKRPLENYLSNKFFIQSYILKCRLIKEGYFEHKCSVCNHKNWQGQVVPIELDHINGNHKDNSLKNLRLLCPNCHAQTPTYRSKNRTK